MRKPVAIDLFCGLGGWTEGLLSEGWDVIGYDIEAHEYGDMKYPATLVLQDVMTIHGSQFKDADLIVASPPCQEYSYMAMPWSKAKAKRAAILADESGEARRKLTALFDACFHIQREACEAAGRHIPMVVENVRGACEWVGQSRWNYGAFHFWGDVPALMPMTKGVLKAGITHRSDGSTNFHQGKYGHKLPGNNGPRMWLDRKVQRLCDAGREETGIKAPGMNWSDRTKKGQDFTRIAGEHAARSAEPVATLLDARFSTPGSISRISSHGSQARKRASAMIAKIPLPLSSHIARVFRP